jgi:anti-sigma regulatory factor (Ser/Thr protein kinase)
MPVIFRMSVAADAEGIAKATTAFGDFAKAQAVPEEVRRGLSVVLDELLTNTISYGLANDGSEVSVDGELHADELTLTVSDSGRPFDPLGEAVPDTTSAVEDRPVGGLGIHLIRHLVDDVRYERRSNRNVVVVTKRLGGGVAGHRGG